MRPCEAGSFGAGRRRRAAVLLVLLAAALAAVAALLLGRSPGPAREPAAARTHPRLAPAQARDPKAAGRTGAPGPLATTATARAHARAAPAARVRKAVPPTATAAARAGSAPAPASPPGGPGAAEPDDDDGGEPEAIDGGPVLPLLPFLVLDGETGAPVMGVHVVVCGPEHEDPLNGRVTDAEGRAAVPVAPGRRLVSITVDGYAGFEVAGARASIDDHDDVSIEVDERACERGLEVRLIRGLEVRGRTFGPDGRPVAAQVICTETLRGVDSAEDGSFRMGFWQAGRYELRAHREGLASAVAAVEVGPGRSGAEVELSLGLATAIAGRVTTRDGRPVEGATVEAMPASPLGPFPEPHMGDPHETRRRSAETDADGRYRLDDLAAGAWDICAHASGFAPAGRAAVTVAPAALPLALDLLLEPGVAIRGRIADEAGPVGGAGVVVRYGRAGGAAGWSIDVDVAAGGRFEIADLAPGEVDLVVASDRHLEAVVRVRAPAEDVVVALRRRPDAPPEGGTTPPEAGPDEDSGDDHGVEEPEPDAPR